MKINYLAITALSAAMLLAGQAGAQDRKTLAIVVKGLDVCTADAPGFCENN